MPRFVSISTNTDLLRFPSDVLMYIEADGNYSILYTKDGKRRQVPFQLGQLEHMIEVQLGYDESPFMRAGKSLIVNMDFIYELDLTDLNLILSDWCGNLFKFKVSRKALGNIKSILENTER